MAVGKNCHVESQWWECGVTKDPDEEARVERDYTSADYISLLF